MLQIEAAKFEIVQITQGSARDRFNDEMQERPVVRESRNNPQGVPFLT
jgi:hypothetical protein